MKRREMFKALAVAPIAMLNTIPVPKQLIEWSIDYD